MSWRKLPFSARRKLGKQNLLVHLPGVIGIAKNAKTISSSWYCFMNDSILDQIVKYTNQYIEFISDTEQSNEECNSEESDCENYLAYRRQRGKDIDFMSWRKLPFSARRKLGKQNLLVHLPGVIGITKNAKTISSSWYCFMNDSILDQIVKYTNQYIEFISSEYARSRDARKTDLIEIKAFIGLLYLAGVYKSARLNLEVYYIYGDGSWRLQKRSPEP
ncbi:Transposase IS4 [Popillia japonica]|uniref:Transposase IS4 n=1 Tax=Popillia japonica TaxID=7064 RepID=A0AAW1N1I3_POPJA